MHQTRPAAAVKAAPRLAPVAAQRLPQEALRLVVQLGTAALARQQQAVHLAVRALHIPIQRLQRVTGLHVPDQPRRVRVYVGVLREP